ncbi:uncharacterized protein [Aegilops tauschii subsp. strangulata]|uniref:uncharacterized protein n=1 Tax=Aegilops tauschii subsp. strangulata TaxID=200361 RepID=UPI00098B4C7D|nr:uncharacterized protein LOC109734551 [Aegilops tauschii subsp. strangulata]
MDEAIPPPPANSSGDPAAAGQLVFVKQVRDGNRTNTHLASNAYDEVGREFKLITGLEYINDQLKNKWDKLRGQYNIFKKLKLKETGAGWDIKWNTVKQDAEWWKKAKIDIQAITCGAIESSDEHFIAYELFIKREQREMFLSMSAETRLGWLKRKFSVKYGN